MVFASIALMQKAVAFECRSTDRSLFAIGPFTNRLLDAAMALEAVALLAFIYVPVLAGVLGQRPLTAAEWTPVAITPFVIIDRRRERKAIVRARRAASQRMSSRHPMRRDGCICKRTAAEATPRPGLDSRAGAGSSARIERGTSNP